MQPPTVTLHKKTFSIFMACLAVAVMVLGGIATSKYGAGVASDSVKYLAVAQNLLDGNGLFDHRGFPLLSWPPLYSMLLAGLSLITDSDVFVAGWYFNVFLLGLNLVLSGVIFQRVFFTKPVYAYLAGLFVFLSISSLRIHATIGSDAPYLTCTLIFLITLDGYVQRRSYNAFIWVVLLCALAPLLRYVGLALAATAAIVILVETRKSVRILLRDGFIMSLFSIAPIFWWLIIRNVMTYGSLWGTSSGQVVNVFLNTELALTKMLHWFVPYFSVLIPVLTRPFIVIGILALVLVLINRKRKENWFTWARTFAAPVTYPTMIYALIYFSAVALTIITSDHDYLYSDRYYVILLVPTMIFVFVTYDQLIRPHLNLSARQIAYGLSVVFALWTIYPLYGIREYLANALERGEPSDYNLFNTRAYHESIIVPEMQRLRESQPDAIIYSNYVDAVWFYTRKPANILPLRGVPDLTAAYAGWPHAKPGYIVWFKPNEYKHYLSPEELAQFGSLELIYTDPSGDIYYVQSR
jgi:hypothetical protein